MSNGRFYPNLHGQAPHDVEEAIYRAFDYLYQLRTEIDVLDKELGALQAQPQPSTAITPEPVPLLFIPGQERETGAGTAFSRLGEFVFPSNFILKLGFGDPFEDRSNMPEAKNIIAVHGSIATDGDVLGGSQRTNQLVAKTGTVQGFESYVKTSHATGSVVLAIATPNNIEHAGAGTLTEGRSIQAGGNVTGSGTITTFRCYHAQPIAVTGAGSVTNGYILFANAWPAGVTNKFGLHIAATDTINILGLLRIGTGGPQLTTPGATTIDLQPSAANTQGALRLLPNGTPGGVPRAHLILSETAAGGNSWEIKNDTDGTKLNSIVTTKPLQMQWGGTLRYQFEETVVRPDVDNNVTNGTASKRWSDLRSVLINGADIALENGWRFREWPCRKEDIGKPGEWFKKNANMGVQILDDEENLMAVIHKSGYIYCRGILPLDELELQE